MPWFNVKVDKIVHKATREVVLDEVDDDLVADVDELHVSITSFGFVNRLIDLFIIRNSLAEVSCRCFRILALIIG